MLMTEKGAVMKKSKKIARRLLSVLIFVLAGFAFAGCEMESDDAASSGGGSSSSSSSGGTISTYAETSSSVTSEITDYNSSDEIDIASWPNSYSPNASSRDIITDASSYENVSFDGTLYVDLSSLQISADNFTWTSVTDGGDAETVTLDSTEISANISDGVLYIDSSSCKSNLQFDITGTAEKAH